MILLLLFAFSLIFLREVPRLIQRRYWRELLVFCLFMAVAMLLSVLLTIGVELPQVSTAIGDLFLK